jgi:hypothetical protein
MLKGWERNMEERRETDKGTKDKKGRIKGERNAQMKGMGK